MALDYLPSPSWAVIYGETPSATRWSELGENDDALATGAGIDDLAILTRHLAAAIVTPSKLATGAATAFVATTQTTASATYANLATVGPTVATTIGSNGLALVIVHGWTYGTIATANHFIGFDVSGASTVAASDQFAAEHRIIDTATGYNNQIGATFLVTGLTPGSNTFTAKYKVNAGTGTFFDRKITVKPL